jgi:signal transduction histidine kinase
VNELVEHVCEDLRPLLEAKRLKLHKKLEPLFSIDCDTALIQEVILNLIDNAIKYTPEGGEIHIATYEKADFVFFEVKDTGEGITARDQERLFNKFARGQNQDLRTQGTGLGLYLVKYFIELHKGKVLLESSPQRGTRVTVSIPTVIQISENDLILKRDPTLKKEEGDNHEQNIANA